MGGAGAPARNIWLGAALVLIAAGSIAAAREPTPRDTALGSVAPGLWRIRTLESAVRTDQRLCLANPDALLQLRHGAMSCTQFVISNSPRDALVHYSCPRAGWGRTSLHVVSATEVEIETQGIAGNAPFAFKAEAKRVGRCDAGRTSAGR